MNEPNRPKWTKYTEQTKIDRMDQSGPKFYANVAQIERSNNK